MPSAESQPPDGLTLQLRVEEVAVTRHRVIGDTVRVETVTRSTSHIVDEDLTHERIEVTHVAIGRPVEAAPPVRTEGDTTILSVVEEVVVIERRLMLREEVHVRRIRVSEKFREAVTVRRQDAVITRIAADRTLADAGTDRPHADVGPAEPTRQLQDQ